MKYENFRSLSVHVRSSHITHQCDHRFCGEERDGFNKESNFSYYTPISLHQTR